MQRIDPLRINCLQDMAGQLLRRVFSDQQISESKGRMNANERLLENDTEVLLSNLIFHRCRRSNIGEKHINRNETVNDFTIVCWLNLQIA